MVNTIRNKNKVQHSVGALMSYGPLKYVTTLRCNCLYIWH